MAISARAQALLEKAFYPAIFSRMECQNRRAPARFETLRQEPQKRFKSGKLVVYCNAKRLKYPAQSGLPFARIGQRMSDDCAEIPRRADRAFGLGIHNRRGQ